MITRRHLLAIAVSSLPAAACAATDRPADQTAAATALLDRYVAAVNAHDTAPFPDLFTEAYVQHSGRSASGLAAQIENFRRIFQSMPDIRMRIEDRIVAGDKIVARNTFSATHTQPLRGIAPTGKTFSFHTIDIWRIENGKFAEHWDLTDTAEVLNQLRGG